MPDRRMALREASVLLGVSEGAIRKRVARGTIRSEKGDDGLRYVWVDAGTDGGEDASYTSGTDRELLYEEMRERIAYLERQVEEEREARRRADTLLARLMDNVPLWSRPRTLRLPLRQARIALRSLRRPCLCPPARTRAGRYGRTEAHRASVVEVLEVIAAEEGRGGMQ